MNDASLTPRYPEAVRHSVPPANPPEPCDEASVPHASDVDEPIASDAAEVAAPHTLDVDPTEPVGSVEAVEASEEASEESPQQHTDDPADREAGEHIGRPATRAAALVANEEGHVDDSHAAVEDSPSEDASLQYEQLRGAGGDEPAPRVPPRTAVACVGAREGDGGVAETSVKKSRRVKQTPQKAASGTGTESSQPPPRGAAPCSTRAPQRNGHRSAVRGAEGLAAVEASRRSESTHAFWTNRLHLLRREVEAARLKAHMRRLEDDHHEAASLANATVASQLRAERQRTEAHRLERAEAIRRQRSEHRTAFRAALHQTVHARLEGGRALKAESRQHRSMVEQLRAEVLAGKRAQRGEVVAEKERAAERREKERAIRAEKARRLYEGRAQHLWAEAGRRDEETRGLVEESAQLLEQLRRLERLDECKDGEVTAGAIEDAVS